jgi:hypothetical protein
MAKRTLVTALALASCLQAGPHRAEAVPGISLGSRIDISPTTFALPILITDAVELVAWDVGLTYDPTDVQTTSDSPAPCVGSDRESRRQASGAQPASA